MRRTQACIHQHTCLKRWNSAHSWFVDWSLTELWCFSQLKPQPANLTELVLLMLPRVAFLAFVATTKFRDGYSEEERFDGLRQLSVPAVPFMAGQLHSKFTMHQILWRVDAKDSMYDNESFWLSSSLEGEGPKTLHEWNFQGQASNSAQMFDNNQREKATRCRWNSPLVQDCLSGKVAVKIWQKASQKVWIWCWRWKGESWLPPYVRGKPPTTSLVSPITDL